jgi:hypothetical protein
MEADMTPMISILLASNLVLTFLSVWGARLLARRAERLSLRSRAREMHEGVVQSLAIAKLAVDVGDVEATRRAIDRSVASTRAVISALLGQTEGHIKAGDLRKAEPVSAASV